jgi:ABC-type transporter Mla maintaining outer membrane lipid asymmetry ATPase subunit MlaF
MNATPPVLQMTGVRKAYASLRPLRIQSLAVAPAERVALSGLDLVAAELMVNLVTGATLPDEGQVRVFGRGTADIVNGEEWLASLDRFGIISDRAVFLEGATLAQNLALPFTLEIDPISPDTRELVLRLAEECDISPEWLDQPGGELPPAIRARVHLARAVALGPALLLIEHPTAGLPDADRGAYGSIVARVCEARALAALVMTLDTEFATAAAHRTLTLQPATGELAPAARRSWFRRSQS